MEKTWDEINFEDYLPTGKQMLEAALMAELIDQDSYDDFIERRGNEMSEFEEELSSLPVSKSTNYTEYWNKAQLLTVFKDWKPQQPQQSMPVVPQCVAEFIESYKDRRTIYGVFDKISKNRKTYPKLFEWVFEDENSQATFALAFITGKYEVEKQQLFYLKNKLTGMYLYKKPIDGYGEEPTSSIKKYLTDDFKFTQQEIDSMQTGSYELVSVEDGE